jgi:hypothetical protein
MPEGHINQYERAFRAWPLLTSAATNHSTITYAGLGGSVGLAAHPCEVVPRCALPVHAPARRPFLADWKQ